MRSDFANGDLVLIDAPGCGAPMMSDPEAVTLPFLVRTTLAALEALEVPRAHMMSQCLGGLTALMPARATRERVASLFDTEAIVALED